MMECHGHIMLDGIDYRQAVARHRNGVDEEYVRKTLKRLANAGIEYFRDGGDPYGVSLYASRIAPEYRIEFVSPAFSIHKKGLYGSILGKAYSDFSEYLTLLDEVEKSGGHFVKLVVSGIMTFDRVGELSCPSVDENEIRDLISAAHDRGFSVMVHANGDKAVGAAACADSIEHGYFMSEENMRMLRDNDTIWVPTLSPVEEFSKREGNSGEKAAVTLEIQRNMLILAGVMGVSIACGSDSGASGLEHVASTFREYDLLEKSRLLWYAEMGNALLRERFKA